jgi:hypothetical protein
MTDAHRGDAPGLDFYFVNFQVTAPDRMLPAKGAVCAYVVAVVGDIKRGKDEYHVPEMTPCKISGLLRHLFQKGHGSRGEQRKAILLADPFA